MCEGALPTRSTLTLRFQRSWPERIASNAPEKSCWFLRVVDGVTLQPMLIAYLAHVRQRPAGHASGQTPALPGEDQAKSKGATDKAVREHSTYRFMTVTWNDAQNADTGSDNGGLCGVFCFSLCA